MSDLLGHNFAIHVGSDSSDQQSEMSSVKRVAIKWRLPSLYCLLYINVRLPLSSRSAT